MRLTVGLTVGHMVTVKNTLSTKHLGLDLGLGLGFGLDL